MSSPSVGPEPEAQPGQQPSVTRVRADQVARPGVYLKELWQHKHLLRVLAGRELKAQHEVNLVGFLWWLMEPLSFAAVYFIIVDVVFDRGGPAYPHFVLISLLSYKWLVQGITGAMGTVRANSSLIANLYFPRALLPVVDVTTGLAHYLIGVLVIPFFMLGFGVDPTWHLLWLPGVIAVQFFFMLGLAYPAAAIGLNYRNLPRLVGNVMRAWFYMSPGIWALSRIPENRPDLLRLIKFNPLTGLFESFRGAIGVLAQDCPDCPVYQVNHAPGIEILAPIVVALLGLTLGGWLFVRRERTFGKFVT